MEHEMAAIEQKIKMEVGEIKVENAEVDTESFGNEQNSWGLAVEAAGSLGSQRLKDDHNSIETRSNMEVLEMQATKIKVEENWEDCQPFEPMYVTEGGVPKEEHNDDFGDGNTKIALKGGREEEILRQQLTCTQCAATFANKKNLDNHTIRKHPHSIESVSSKIFECSQCTYKTVWHTNYIRHVSSHSKTVNLRLIKCIHCEGYFQGKKSLDDHIIREHPDFKASVSSKIHECPHCKYITTSQAYIAKHLTKHEERVNSKCYPCNVMFKTREGFAEHVIREHPDLKAYLPIEIHECSQCTFATAWKSTLEKHMLKHSDELKTCTDCDITFKNERWLEKHRTKEHSDSIQAFECTQCAYKTNLRPFFDRHLLTHRVETEDGVCVHCNLKFKHKRNLTEHIFRKHSDSAASISVVSYECQHCTFKSTLRSSFNRHMLGHPEVPNSRRCVCARCGLTLKNKRYLDEHTVKKHPDSIGSITRKIYECKHCSYKTTLSDRFSSHVMQHPETEDSSRVRVCEHCGAGFKTKRGLDEHTIRRHPDFIASVSSKIRACEYCPYKSTMTHHFANHMLKHSGLGYNKCTHCEAAFNSKAGLCEHIVRKHPDSIESVPYKIHECTHCTYKTALKSSLTVHMRQHCPDTQDSLLSSCSHCESRFKSKQGLDEHTLRKHPEFASSVTSKIHECTFCTYQTTMKCSYTRHMMQYHPVSPESCKVISCSHCAATFKSKQTLDEHVFRKHPDFASSVTSKVHECTICSYKTTLKCSIVRHMTKHS